MSLTSWPPLLRTNRLSPLPDPAGRHWVFQELTDLGQLAAEGLQMHHCVVWYRYRCQSGKCAIFSLRRGQPGAPRDQYRRVLTIELETETRTIVQVKGQRNRRARPYERYVIRQWAKANDLRWL